MKTFFPLTILLVMSGAIANKPFVATNRTNYPSLISHSRAVCKLGEHSAPQMNRFDTRASCLNLLASRPSANEPSLREQRLNQEGMA